MLIYEKDDYDPRDCVRFVFNFSTFCLNFPVCPVVDFLLGSHKSVAITKVAHG